MVLTSLRIYRGVFKFFRFYGVRTNQHCKLKEYILITQGLLKIFFWRIKKAAITAALVERVATFHARAFSICYIKPHFKYINYSQHCNT